MIRTLDVLDLGLLSYKEAYELQSYYHQGLINQKRSLDPNVDQKIINNTLILVEHPHIFTLGTSGKAEHLKLKNEELFFVLKKEYIGQQFNIPLIKASFKISIHIFLSVFSLQNKFKSAYTAAIIG